MTRDTAEPFEFVSHPNKTFVSYQSAEPDQKMSGLIWIQLFGTLMANKCLIWVRNKFKLLCSISSHQTFVSYQSAKQFDPDQARRFLIWVQNGYLQTKLDGKNCFVFLTGSLFLTSYHCLSVCLSSPTHSL